MPTVPAIFQRHGVRVKNFLDTAPEISQCRHMDATADTRSHRLALIRAAHLRHLHRLHKLHNYTADPAQNLRETHTYTTSVKENRPCEKNNLPSVKYCNHKPWLKYVKKHHLQKWEKSRRV